MTQFKIGDSIKIPKGTDYWSMTDDDYESDQTTRTSTAEVKDVIHKKIYEYDNHHFSEIWVVARSNYLPRIPCWEPNLNPDLSNTRAEAEQAFDASGRPTDLKIHWLNHWADWQRTKASIKIIEAGPFLHYGNRMVRTADVTKVEAKTPATRTLTTKQRMVAGSEWALTADANLYDSWLQVYQTMPRDSAWMIPSNGTLPKGTVIKIVSKFKNGHIGTKMVPMTHLTENGPVTRMRQEWVGTSSVEVKYTINNVVHTNFLRYEEIKEATIVGDQQIIPEFVIRDTVSGKFYGGLGDWSNQNGTWKRSEEYKVVDRYTKAKKFKRLADVRTHLLVVSGYYYDLPGSWDSVPEWMISRKEFDVPSTWEIVKIDKITKDELEKIDLTEAFNRSWRLREITLKYGSLVRKIYNDLESKGKTPDWEAVIVFNNNESEYLSEEQIAECNKLVESLEPSQYRIVKNEKTFAISAIDVDAAVTIRLSYKGSATVSVVDFATMQEIANR